MPTPQLSKTLDEVRSMVFGHVEDVQEEYAAKGWLPRRLNLNKGVVRGLLEIFCWGLYQLYQLLAAVFVQAAPTEATDEAWMEWHAEQVEAPRKQATKAVGIVRFARTATSGNTPIPAGRIVRTLPDGSGNVYRFVTTAGAVIADGTNEVAVPVVAEEYGAASNVSAGQITELVTTVPGVDIVGNSADWLTSEGADLETLEKLRERYILRWLGNNGMTKYAYASWALSVAGVVAVKVLDQHPRGQGTVDAIVKGSAGIPTDTLLGLVRAAVATGAKPEEVQAGPPINDDWEVRGPQPLSLAIAGELEIKPGYHVDTVVALAEQRVRAIFTDPATVAGVIPLQIGEDVPLDRLTGVVMAVEGVKRVNWTSPVADQVVADDGLAVLESLAFTTVEAGEE
ncbi:putative phage protein gp47/JayE [Pseudodesulfovibrio indicus]|uniref:Baseplate J family protein n=1 Tax=Pseudodesulfovibrio indicus TaxID=1716143 RepID=A0A126QLA8_9BACT|nr:baseplate J/gp47 family protein [Pseudodesulfovibrio indicus]AMK10843.1 baseplate J family protein [Pseudodesulfovibrio indicus]TDT91837.1 putative phage protein gp47/JayE [Pseudodesulfovibrio indicus]